MAIEGLSLLVCNIHVSLASVLAGLLLACPCIFFSFQNPENTPSCHFIALLIYSGVLYFLAVGFEIGNVASKSFLWHL